MEGGLRLAVFRPIGTGKSGLFVFDFKQKTYF
jgi:hypothetical protein